MTIRGKILALSAAITVTSFIAGYFVGLTVSRKHYDEALDSERERLKATIDRIRSEKKPEEENPTSLDIREIENSFAPTDPAPDPIPEPREYRDILARNGYLHEAHIASDPDDVCKAGKVTYYDHESILDMIDQLQRTSARTIFPITEEQFIDNEWEFEQNFLVYNLNTKRFTGYDSDLVAKDILGPDYEDFLDPNYGASYWCNQDLGMTYEVTFSVHPEDE